MKNVNKKQEIKLKSNKKNNGSYSKTNKKRKKKISYKRMKEIVSFITIFIILFMLFILLYFGYYIYFNVKLYNLAISEENTFTIGNFTKYFSIWEKTRDYIKENNKEIILDGKEYDISLNSESIPNKFDFDIVVKYEKSNYNEFKDLDCINVVCNNENKVSSINKITLDINEGYFKNNIDIYEINNITSAINIKETCISTQNNKVDISVFNKEKSIEENNNSYILVYVPLEDLKLQNEYIELNNNSNISLEFEFIPSNSTNKKIKFEYSNEALEIDENYSLNAKIAGEYSIKANVENENIEKEFKVKVIEVANNIKLKSNSVTLNIGQTYNIEAKVYPENANNSDLKYISSNEKIAMVDEKGNIKTVGIGKCEIEVSTVKEPIISNKVTVQVKEKSETTSSSDNLTYINGILVVNKKYGLPSNYNPGVNSTALNAFNTMKNSASKEGINLFIVSGFRSYSTQASLYNNYVNTYGQEVTDTFSAKPGHSEHQTGLAFDVNSVLDSFANTKEGKWLADNCYKYGFIIRYPKNKQSITGYKYEPWHIRYLGVDIATKVYNSGLCLEEYLGI